MMDEYFLLSVFIAKKILYEISWVLVYIKYKNHASVSGGMMQVCTPTNKLDSLSQLSVLGYIGWLKPR